MADLDEISMMLGEIRSDMRHALKWFEEHENKDQERFEKLTVRIEAGNHVKTRVQQLERDLEAAKPIISSISNAKWVVVGFIVAVGLVGGALGGYAQNLLKMLL